MSDKNDFILSQGLNITTGKLTGQNGAQAEAGTSGQGHGVGDRGSGGGLGNGGSGGLFNDCDSAGNGGAILVNSGSTLTLS